MNLDWKRFGPSMPSPRPESACVMARARVSAGNWRGVRFVSPKSVSAIGTEIPLDVRVSVRLGLRIMARFARVVVFGIPRHVKHRANQRECAFFGTMISGDADNRWEGTQRKFLSCPQNHAHVVSASVGLAARRPGRFRCRCVFSNQVTVPELDTRRGK